MSPILVNGTAVLVMGKGRCVVYCTLGVCVVTGTGAFVRGTKVVGALVVVVVVVVVDVVDVVEEELVAGGWENVRLFKYRLF